MYNSDRERSKVADFESKQSTFGCLTMSEALIKSMYANLTQSSANSRSSAAFDFRYWPLLVTLMMDRSE